MGAEGLRQASEACGEARVVQFRRQQPARPAEGKEEQVKLLLADDSPTQRRVMTRRLEAAGYTVVEAEDGISAYDLVLAERPHLVVSDVLMPGLNGYQLCRLLKMDPATRGLPVILLTSLSDQLDRFWAEESGADAFVGKEEPFERLTEAVERLAPAGREAAARIAGTGGVRGVASERLNQVLERLLFESAVSRRVRDLLRVGRRREDLAAALMDLLTLLFDPARAGLAVTGRALPPLLLCLDRTGGEEPDPMAELLASRMEEEPRRVVECRPVGSVEAAAVDASWFAGEEVVTDQLLVVPVPVQEGSAYLWMVSQRRLRFGARQVETARLVARGLADVLDHLGSLERYDRLQADFASMIVHDLRSPLTSILSGLSIFRRHLGETIPERFLKILDTMEDSAKRLLTLVTDFLDLSKIEAGRMEVSPRPVQPGEVVARVLESIRLQAESKGIEVTASIGEEELQVLADPERITQVLWNLLSNALKFTPEGGRVELSVVRDDSGVSVWTVRDTGPGIPEEEQEGLFDKYRQASTARRSAQKGTGLGLAICKEIVEAHGGRIWVESRPGEGAAFRFTLPLAKADTEGMPRVG